jgi:hypothetical protein
VEPLRRAKKNCLQDLKKQNSPRGDPYENYFSSGAPLRGPVATSEPAIEISAKGRDEPTVRSLHQVLTHHCRELVLLAYLQQEKVWDT